MPGGDIPLLGCIVQCTDIFFLGADICQLGVDQRKVRHAPALAARRGVRLLSTCLHIAAPAAGS